MERHEPSGQYYNWYDHRRREADGLAADRRPIGDPPILSSVDNGWLAAALQVVSNTVPRSRLSRRDLRQHGLRLLLPAGRQPDRLPRRAGYGASPCCYDTIVSESRIASYIGIAKGELPAKEYFGAWRTFPDTCDWSWPETKPIGFHATYLGVNVFEGAYPYEDFRVVPGWGGACSRRSCPPCSSPRSSGARRAGRSTTR